jgi:copper(I)-binding protein
VTHVTALVALISLTVFGLTVPVVATKDTSQLATPATVSDEITGAVPISMTIRNDCDADDQLRSARTPAAARVEIHRGRLVDGRRVMEAAPDGIAIPAGETLNLEPSSDHLMLVSPLVDLVQGETFPLTLTFTRAGELTVTVRVRRRVDAAGLTPFPPVTAGDLSVSLASAPPAPAGIPTTPAHP